MQHEDGSLDVHNKVHLTKSDALSKAKEIRARSQELANANDFMEDDAPARKCSYAMKNSKEDHQGMGKSYAQMAKDDLTTQGRERIKPKNFALPKEKAYPIHDIEHARNALARVSQHGTPEEQRKVRAAVHKKYPSLSKALAGDGTLMMSHQQRKDLEKAYEGFKAVEESARRSGAKDPAAVAAAVGRKKYGKEAFQEAAAHGKKMGKSEMKPGMSFAKMRELEKNDPAVSGTTITDPNKSGEQGNRKKPSDKGLSPEDNVRNESWLKDRQSPTQTAPLTDMNGRSDPGTAHEPPASAMSGTEGQAGSFRGQASQGKPGRGSFPIQSPGVGKDNPSRFNKSMAQGGGVQWTEADLR
ncbi:MAG TPA: hypothetical protein VJR06_08145, partial [Nitrososphaerales archaeon]|nr:hypothetical protein [Nitrososphaerales archaeon]